MPATPTGQTPPVGRHAGLCGKQGEGSPGGSGACVSVLGAAAPSVAAPPSSGQPRGGGRAERRGGSGGHPSEIRTFTQQGRPRGRGLLRLHRVVVVVAGPRRRAALARRFPRRGLAPGRGPRRLLHGVLSLVQSRPLVQGHLHACLGDRDSPVTEQTGPQPPGAPACRPLRGRRARSAAALGSARHRPAPLAARWRVLTSLRGWSPGPCNSTGTRRRDAGPPHPTGAPGSEAARSRPRKEA